MFTHHLTKSAVAGALTALALAPPAFAGQPPRSDLNPPPPDDYTCQATGPQTICRTTRAFQSGPEVTDVDCNFTGATFPITDQGYVEQELTRRYDANGNFVERVIRDRWLNAMWSNPLTGATVPYTQRDITTDRATVPGDLDSITETLTGENQYTDPVTHKNVLHSAGRTVFASDGTLESASGQQPFIERYLYGDPSAFADLCAALAR